jgi:hypothetical protein
MALHPKLVLKTNQLRKLLKAEFNYFFSLFQRLLPSRALIEVFFMNESDSERRQNYYHVREKAIHFDVIWIYEAGNENS